MHAYGENFMALHTAAASVFGVASVAGEGLFVGTLAVLEWRGRESLVNSRAHRS